MTPLAIDFENLHQVLRNLYQEMMPLCGDMVGVAKGVAGLGALFYVAYRVWKALANAEPVDVFPLLRPFAIGLCIMFFPTIVLGTINTVLSPVVQGTHAILEGQTLDMSEYQKQKEDLEYEARVREGKAWLVDDEVYDQKLADLGITDMGEIIGMWWERTWHGIKSWFRELVRDFFDLLFNAASLTVDTLRTFFLVVLSILGPLSFALSIYDGFQSTLTHWLSKYICVYLWLPIADLFSAVLAKIQNGSYRPAAVPGRVESIEPRRSELALPEVLRERLWARLFRGEVEKTDLLPMDVISPRRITHKILPKWNSSH